MMAKQPKSNAIEDTGQLDVIQKGSEDDRIKM